MHQLRDMQLFLSYRGAEKDGEGRDLPDAVLSGTLRRLPPVRSALFPQGDPARPASHAPAVSSADRAGTADYRMPPLRSAVRQELGWDL